MCVFAITETVINPTPGNVVKEQIIMFMSGNINKTISGHEPMTIGNTQSYLEKIRHEPIFDYRELGNDLEDIFVFGALSQCMDPYTFCTYVVVCLVKPYS